MHYLGRKSCDEVAARNGYLLSTGGIHLSDRAAAVVADLVADWLTAP
jgi:acyl-CoA thioesterase I